MDGNRLSFFWRRDYFSHCLSCWLVDYLVDSISTFNNIKMQITAIRLNGTNKLS